MSLVSSNAAYVDRIYREHSGWLRSWLDRQRWTVHSPEDIASDVFLSLLTMPSVSTLREPRAMMTTIARRAIYDARRRKRLQISYEDALSAAPQAVDASPEEKLIILQALREIDQILSKMSDRARAAFLMSQIDGMPNKDIAERLGVSVSAVSKYMTQGFTALYAAKSRNL